MQVTGGGGVVGSEQIVDGSIVNDDISAGAAIARSKLAGVAGSGANSDITSLSALSTPLSVAQGGTGQADMINAEIFVPVLQDGTLFPYDQNISKFAGISIGNGAQCSFIFKVPLNFVSLVSVEVCMIPDATETIQWDAGVDWGAAGELHTANQATDLNRQLAVTINVLTRANVNQGNIATSLAGLAAGDFCAVNFISNTDNLRPIGLLFTYVPTY